MRKPPFHPIHPLKWTVGLLPGLCAGVWGLLAGCQPTLDTRTALIVQTLVDADRDLIANRPALLATKYEVMAEGLQPFLRGTAGIFYRDLSRYQDEAAQVPHGVAAEQVQLYGDIHLENVGVTFDTSGVLFDCVDFDSTVQGPFGWEVRRTALSLRAALSLSGQPDAVLDEVVARLGQSYAQTMRDRSQQSADTNTQIRESSPQAGKIVLELLADGKKRNDQQEELSQYTEVVSKTRKLLRNADLQDMPSPWAGDLPQLIAAYRDTRRSGRGQDSQYQILDAAQRFNSGVASLPNLRFWVLLSGPNPNGNPMRNDPEWILEFKEERDPPLPLGWLGRGPIGKNDARVLAGTRLLLASPDSEADLGAVRFAGVSFQVRRVLRGRRDLDVAKLTERTLSGRYGVADLKDLAATLGGLIANGHARAGHPLALWNVLAKSDGTGDGFTAYLVDQSRSDVERLGRDFVLFQAARDLLGPLLGARQN
ncbi:MAG TPA: DUF2252 family protein [Pseudomonadota bacterium]|nr:DUF2252 family protein [Pseudomonadota bacterium]